MKVLISGASMAGLCAAYWFTQHGHDVTVVERANTVRQGGAPIDVRGRAIGTAERMGVRERIERENVVNIGATPVFDGAGTQVATMDLKWFGNETDEDVEITRDRLNQILLDALPAQVDFRFSESIVSISDGPEGADVGFAGNWNERYQLVIGADGLHSNVRRLVFGPEENFLRHIGYYVALVNLPRNRTWQRGSLNIPGFRISVRDTGDGPRALMLAKSAEIAYDHRDVAMQRDIVDRFLSRVDAWQLGAIRNAFADPNADGFYFDSVSQTRMPSWTRGHVAVIGDAGHCASLMSGMGTTLAMVAAETLANVCTEFAGNLEAASSVYHERLRPYVEQCQAHAFKCAPIMVPETQHDLDARNAQLRHYAETFVS